MLSLEVDSHQRSVELPGLLRGRFGEEGLASIRHSMAFTPSERWQREWLAFGLQVAYSNLSYGTENIDFARKKFLKVIADIEFRRDSSKLAAQLREMDRERANWAPVREAERFLEMYQADLLWYEEEVAKAAVWRAAVKTSC